MPGEKYNNVSWLRDTRRRAGSSSSASVCLIPDGVGRECALAQQFALFALAEFFAIDDDVFRCGDTESHLIAFDAEGDPEA